MQLSISDYIRLARGVPAYQIPLKAWSVVRRFAQELGAFWQDRVLGTHPADAEIPKGELPHWLGPLDPHAMVAWRPVLEQAASDVLAHRFDLLGSGPVVVRHGLRPAGVEGHCYDRGAGPGPINRSNRALAHRLKSFCPQAYVPIDWHVDFKSGYRWFESVWYRQIDYGMLAGVDVKVPWELARCQHLPQLALAALWAEPERKQQLVSEFRHQVLDFAANNPPRFGVNWCCTMDVAIRAANWVLAYQLFRSTTVGADTVFEREFKRTLLAHGRHIVGNLEWYPGLRSNHYLSNVCGLLFVAAQLPEGPETDAWLAVAVPELVQECLLQFQPDGSNFEASTSYHRLSAEMVLYALALLRALPEERLDRVLREGPRQIRYRGGGPDPRGFVQRLEGVAAIPWATLAERMARAREFTRAVTRPDGGVVQVGDNDSGRFFCVAPQPVLSPAGPRCPAPSDHSHLLCALDVLMQGSPAGDNPDAQVVAALVRRRGLGRDLDEANPGLALQAFPDFGLYVYAGERFWCALRCGSVGQRGNGGHAHNDQLSIELCADGVAFLVDPGTYLYTPLPDRRNQLRSTGAHNTFVLESEQNLWLPGRLGLFSLSEVGDAEVLECQPGSWTARSTPVDGRSCTRAVRFGAAGLQVDDACEGTFALNFQIAPGCMVVSESARRLRLERQGRVLWLAFDQGQCVVGEGLYSAAYGLVESAPRVRVEGLSGRVCWTAEVCDLECQA